MHFGMKTPSKFVTKMLQNSASLQLPITLIALVLLALVQAVSGQSSSTSMSPLNSTDLGDNKTLRLEKAQEWGKPGKFSFLVISETGYDTAPNILNITSRFLTQQRGDKVDLFFVNLGAKENDVRKAICDQLRGPQRSPAEAGALTGSATTINAIIDTTRTQELTVKVAAALVSVRVPTFAMGCCSSKSARSAMSTSEQIGDQSMRLTFASLAHYMTRAARHIVDNETLGTAALYYDDRFELESGHQQLLAGAPVRHIYASLAYSSRALIADQLKRATDTLYNIFLFTNVRTAESYIMQAEGFRLAKAKYSWFVFTTDLADFKCTNCKEARVNVFRPEPLLLEEATKLLEFFKTQDILLVVSSSAAATRSAQPNTNESLSTDYSDSVDGVNTTTAVELATGGPPKLNATMQTKVLFYYDTLSASVKILKQLADKMTSIDVREAMCGTSLVATSAAAAFNMSEVAAETEHLGVLGLVTARPAPGKVADGLVYVNANMRVTQYDFRGNTSIPEGSAEDDVENNVTMSSVIATGEPNITEYGIWTLEDGLQRNPTSPPKWPLSRKIYRITIMDIKPFVFKKANVTPTVWQGYCIDLINAIGDDLGFGYTLYEVKDKTYGTLNDTTGEWDGLVRELQQKNADIALAPLSVMAERENVIDFTVPYFDLVGITILMKKNREKPALFKFIEVLEGQVWFAIIGAYVVTSILLFIFDRFSPYSYRNVLKRRERELQQQQRQQMVATTGISNGYKTTTTITTTTDDVLAPEEDFYGSRVFTLKESFWFCMTSLTPQGGGEAPRNLSGRLVAAVSAKL